MKTILIFIGLCAGTSVFAQVTYTASASKHAVPPANQGTVSNTGAGQNYPVSMDKTPATPPGTPPPAITDTTGQVTNKRGPLYNTHKQTSEQ